jgi:hypothetical protein
MEDYMTVSQRALEAAKELLKQKEIRGRPETKLVLSRRYAISDRILFLAQKILSSGNEELIKDVEKGDIKIYAALKMLEDHSNTKQTAPKEILKKEYRELFIRAQKLSKEDLATLLEAYGV